MPRLFDLAIRSTSTKYRRKCSETFEMWLYKRLLRMSCIYRVTNNNVLERTGKEKEISDTKNHEN